MFEMKPYEVYVKVDERNRIISVNSSAFLTDFNGWIKIDEGFGDKHHHAQGNYFPDGLFEMEYMIPKYEYIDGIVFKRGEEEIAEDIAAIINVEPAPTQLDIIEAQVTYTALMTDTLLEV